MLLVLTTPMTPPRLAWGGRPCSIVDTPSTLTFAMTAAVLVMPAAALVCARVADRNGEA